MACTSTNGVGLTRDCPAPAAAVGANKCYQGTNNGATCTLAGDCPSGTCAQFVGDIPISLNPLSTGTTSLSNAGGLFCPTQLAGQKGAFKADVCKGGTNDGKACFSITDCPGGTQCRSGALNNMCSGGANIGKGCIVAADCPAATCVHAGTLAQLIRETGTPAGALVVGTPASIKLGSVFCVPATSSAAVNGTANLPGPGATTVVGTITLLP